MKLENIISMRCLSSIYISLMLIIALTTTTYAVISEQEAIQSVRMFVGNPSAQVTSSVDQPGLTLPVPTGSRFDFWANLTSCYWLSTGTNEYRVNANTGDIECIKVLSDLSIYPSDALSVEYIWSRYPSLPRSQMQNRYTNIGSFECWMLRNPDQSWVYGKQIVFWKNEQGLIEMVTTINQPIPLPLPTPTMTSQQAITIGQTIAGSFAWLDADDIVHVMPYYDVVSVEGIDWRVDPMGISEAVYEVTFIISSDPTVSAAWLDPGSSHGVADCGTYHVFVNAMTGAIIFAEPDLFLSMKVDAVSAKNNKTYAKSENMGLKQERRIIPLRTLNSLAKGHKLTAKAGEKAFMMDGKRIALPSKAVAKAGTLYLPWHALKSLPGVKCSYDAQLNKLDITTTPAVKKAK